MLANQVALNDGGGGSMVVIDADTIVAKCEELKKVAEKYKECAKIVGEAADVCTSEALEVNGKNMQGILYELSTALTSYYPGVCLIAETIAEAAVRQREYDLNLINSQRAAQRPTTQGTSTRSSSSSSSSSGGTTPLRGGNSRNFTKTMLN